MLILQLGISNPKSVEIIAEQWLMKAKISGPAYDRRAEFFRKMHQFKVAILLYQSSLEHNYFVKIKETQLFHLVFELTKPYAERYRYHLFLQLIITLLLWQ